MAIKKNGNTPVNAISNINNIALLTLQVASLDEVFGFSKEIFETLIQEDINVFHATRTAHENSICIGINENDSERAEFAIAKTFKHEIGSQKIEITRVEKELSIVTVLGDHIKSEQGIKGKMFSALCKNNINVKAISQGASERNISVVIHKNDLKKASKVLGELFFEDQSKQINIFISGIGNVGSRLLTEIERQKTHIKQHHNIILRVIGISNSRQMLFDIKGIDLNTWKSDIHTGEKASINGFFTAIKTLNLRNSIFIDITANENVANSYPSYLKENIAVIACNKIACSSQYQYYKSLKQISHKYNTPFLFEANVGACLPVIAMLNYLITSGDRIHSIQAVLSGSLNFIFDNYDETNTFHDVVKLAQIEGYTEPDPRIDLSGVDVARKILILARESGIELNLEDIENTSFISQKGSSSNSVDDFYKSLVKDEKHYRALYNSAQLNKCQLKYVAEFNPVKTTVGLKEIPKNHPFYNLKGKDNIVLFYTDLYTEQPLILQGAGAGAEVTASGLFADIIRIAKNKIC